MPDIFDADRRDKEIALHEAGHYVIGRCLGFYVSAIDQAPHRASAGGVPFRPIANVTECLSYIEQRVVALFSGALSETVVSKGEPDLGAAEYLWNLTAKDDFFRSPRAS